jgi:hypothetical protein
MNNQNESNIYPCVLVFGLINMKTVSHQGVVFRFGCLAAMTNTALTDMLAPNSCLEDAQKTELPHQI